MFFRKKITVDPELVQELTRMLDENNLSEIEVQRGDQRVRVSRGGGVETGASALPARKAATAAAPADLAKHPGAVLSPMVGTVFRSPEPGAKPFVEDGTIVREGQTILIVEAMKTMNTIPAPRAGTVTRILVEDGQPVEYGEPLLILE